jgi:hypothetical protein
MTQPIENKEPRPFLIAHNWRKLAAGGATSIRRDGRHGGRSQLRKAGRRTSPSRPSDAPSVPVARQRIRPHDGISRPRMIGKDLTVLEVPHPSRRCNSRRMAASKSFGSKLLPRRTNGMPGSSSPLRLKLVGWKTLARARSEAPSCRPLARSGSTSRLSSRRMPRGPFRTNLAGLGWSGSSGRINLLVVHLASSAASRRPSLQNQRLLSAAIRPTD